MTADDRELVINALKAKGIRLYVGSCGCCQSPWLSLEVDGKIIVGGLGSDGSLDEASINMFEEID